MRDGFPASHCIYSEGEKTFFSPLQIFAFYYTSQTDVLVHAPTVKKAENLGQ